MFQVRALHKQLQVAEKVKSRVEEELKQTAQELAQLKVSQPNQVKVITQLRDSQTVRSRTYSI